MASQLTENEVARIAELARVELSPAERETFARQLTDILSYAAIIQQVPTGPDGPDGPDGPAGPDRARDDVVVPSMSRDEVIDQAPDGVRGTGLFRVPKVL